MHLSNLALFLLIKSFSLANSLKLKRISIKGYSEELKKINEIGV